MKGPGCRPGEQPKSPADERPASRARALAFPGERGVGTVATWFVIDRAAPAAAAVSYTKRMVVTRLGGDGDPDEDTVPLPAALRISGHIPGTVSTSGAAWPVGHRTGESPGHSAWGMTSVSANGRRGLSFRECGRVRSALASYERGWPIPGRSGLGGSAHHPHDRHGTPPAPPLWCSIPGGFRLSRSLAAAPARGPARAGSRDPTQRAGASSCVVRLVFPVFSPAWP